ncbi:MAG: NAD-dependent epimerase/dehydratase family protein [Bacteroidota bacterium]
MNIYTILGAGGSIGNALAKELTEQGKKVRLVSRSGFTMPGTQSVCADLFNLSETIDAVKGSFIVFLCAGLPYNHKVWEKNWPRIMNHSIEACKRTSAKLIFFDNVYMYGRVNGKMTEKTPYYPCSKKGEVRAETARMLCNEMKAGVIQASIARAADLYGPHGTKNSLPYLMVFKNLLKGKQAQWLVNANTIHTFSYTTDCAKAMMLLAKTESSFNQVWHLPSCNPGISGETFIETAAKELSLKSNYLVLKKWMIAFGGIFDTTPRESYEMLYQNEFDYEFDSTKFEKHFNYEPTSYSLGIAETINFLKSG